MKQQFRTIVISDVHLGIKDSKAKELTRFLKYNSCKTLILNGDIIDGWQLRKGGKWKKMHTRLFSMLIKLAASGKTEIIYTRGNHDDFLDEIIPFGFGNFSIVRDLEIQCGDKTYYVVHGDLFDHITTNMKWIAQLGDVGYTLLLRINRYYNKRRQKKGLPYYSLSQKIKAKIKTAVSFIGSYEEKLSEIAKVKKCDGIICGHIHQPANKMIDGIHYLNSGDWVESLTALTETFDGEWNVVHYMEWEKEYRMQKEMEGRSREIKLVHPKAS